jgi:3-methyladenine DNA glycosylase AlkD
VPNKDPRVAATLAWMKKKGTKKNRDGLARYGIVAQSALGVSVGDLRDYAKPFRKDHAFAIALWKTGTYEARMLAAFVDDPAEVTPTQMDAWAKDFDNWAICDHVCFHLFDRTPHAFAKIKQWSNRKDEFVKRGAFALIASVALHDKRAPDRPFLDVLPLIEKAADDDRNFVKKGVSWALRGIGHRGPAMQKAAMDVALRLADSDNAAARWVGRETIRDLSRRPKSV